MRYVFRLVIIAACLYFLAFAYRIYDRKLYVWLPGYAEDRLHQEIAHAKPVHLFVMFADHFEPGGRLDRMKRWESEYPKLADRHRDRSGRRVQHTWFYPGDSTGFEFRRGRGGVESSPSPAEPLAPGVGGKRDTLEESS